MIKRVVAFYFSGTGTTEEVVTRLAKGLAQGLGLDGFVDFNFSLPEARENPPSFGEGDLVLAGVPTIAGRVPNLLLPYLETIEGQGALGVAIAMYGNRAFDDCLMELAHLLEDGGIQIIGGGAFIGEHSFSEVLAQGRPDKDDLALVDYFAQALVDKLRAQDTSEPDLPGNWPLGPYYTPRDRHGEGIDIRKAKPKTKMEICIDCKVCAQACPLGSIDFDQVDQVPGICMKCCACIKKCPTGAKYFDHEGYLYHKEDLEFLYKDQRCVPEVFL